MAASLLQVLDTTIANVAIPHMQSSLGATADTVTWVLTSYIIASAVAMPITGWLSDRIGGRRLFIGSVVGFIAASMLCGMAQNLTEMVIFRALQGVAGAFIAPLSQAFMLDTTRPSKQPQMMAIWGMGVMIGPILGPVLGGWLTENWNWRWVFYVNLPVGLLSLAILMAQLPHRDAAKRRFDLFGFALLAVALSSFQLFLDRGQQVDWFQSLEIWIYAGLAAGCAWMAVIHFATSNNPLFATRLFADRNFSIALLIMLVMGMVMFAPVALLPPMLQHLFGYGVIDTGMVLMPRGIGVLISMQFAGLAIRRGLDARPVIIFGFLLMSLSLWFMAQWSLQVDQFHVVATGVLQGLGMGLVFIPLNISAFATLPPQLRTDGSSLLNLLRSLGASVGISISTVLLTRNMQTVHEGLAGHVTGGIGSVLDFSTVDRYQQLGETALSVLDAEVTRQSAMVAYIDDYYLMCWLSLAAIPLALLMRKNKAPAGPPPADAAGH
jgi:DHA2 family multidrug resistance protein